MPCNIFYRTLQFLQYRIHLLLYFHYDKVTHSLLHYHIYIVSFKISFNFIYNVKLNVVRVAFIQMLSTVLNKSTWC